MIQCRMFNAGWWSVDQRSCQSPSSSAGNSFQFEFFTDRKSNRDILLSRVSFPRDQARGDVHTLNSKEMFFFPFPRSKARGHRSLFAGTVRHDRNRHGAVQPVEGQTSTWTRRNAPSRCSGTRLYPGFYFHYHRPHCSKAKLLFNVEKCSLMLVTSNSFTLIFIDHNLFEGLSYVWVPYFTRVS